MEFRGGALGRTSTSRSGSTGVWHCSTAACRASQLAAHLSLPRISACRASQLAAHLSFSEGSQMRSERMLTTSAASPHMSATPQGTLVAGTAQPQQAGHTYSGHSQTNSYPSNNLQGHNFQDTVAWPALPAPSSSHVTTPAVPAQVATQLPYCPSPEEFMAAWPNKDTMNPQSVAIMPALFATLPPEYQSRFWTAMQEGTVHQFRHVPTSNNATQQHSTPNAAVLGSGGQPWAYQPMTYTQTADIPSALWSAPAAPATVPAIPAQAVSQSNWSIQPMESPIVTPTTLMNIRLRQSMARTLYHQIFSRLSQEDKLRFTMAVYQVKVDQLPWNLIRDAAQQHSTTDAAAPGNGSRIRQLTIRDASMPTLEEVKDLRDMRWLWSQ
jgi:hypothetical protein